MTIVHLILAFALGAVVGGIAVLIYYKRIASKATQIAGQVQADVKKLS